MKSKKSLIIIKASTSVIALMSLIASNSAYAQTSADRSENNEIIVTARKVEESIQEVPVSVTAFSAEDIFQKGFQNIEDISRQTPGFVFDSPFGRQFDRPIIRGQANILGASGVSVFVDGVNVSQSIRSLNFGDVDQIEIIKGPQSALFGRNTYSGAINITTRQPTNEFQGSASVDVGQFGLLEFQGNVGGPIIEDKLYFSLAGRIYDFDSEFDIPENENPSLGNESSRTIGGTLKAYPTDNWSVALRASYNEDDDGHFPIGLLGFDDLNANVPGGTPLGGTQPSFVGVVPTGQPNPSGSSQLSNTLGEGGGLEREELFLALNTNYEFGNGYNIFATAGYTQEKFRDELDSDGQPGSFGNGFIFSFPVAGGAGVGVGLIPLDFTTTDDDEEETFVGEVRIDSPQDQAFKWRLGGYYFDNQSEDESLLGRFEDPRFEAMAQQTFDDAVTAVQVASGAFFSFPAIPFSFGPSNPQVTSTENISVFGSVGYDLSDRLSVTAEARYAEEDIRQVTRDITTNDVTLDVDETFTAFTPRFTADWQVTDDNLLYGVVARGTKPGGFNGSAANDVGFGTFDEETLWTFEVGSKNSFNGNRGVFNLAGFFTTLEGYQLTQSLTALGVAGTTASAVSNLGDVEIFGVELDGNYSPESLPGSNFGFTYAYTNAEFTSGNELAQGLVFGDSSLEGQTLPRQAPHQLSIFGNYNFDVSDDVNVLLSSNGSYLSTRFAQVQNVAETGDSFELDARIGFTYKENYSLTFYGKNITNEDSAIGVLRFLDPLGFNSFTINGNDVPGVFDLRGATQSRGFQFNNRNGARGGVILRAKF